jgi:bifunctional DNA-binding transcriptional regulator/antitoxin component of YhaV-PrlF toxin-antitoxin module
MPRKKELKSSTRKLGKIGSEQNHSYYVTLPIDFIRKLGWQDGQKLIVKRVGKKVHIIDSED